MPSIAWSFVMERFPILERSENATNPFRDQLILLKRHCVSYIVMTNGSLITYFADLRSADAEFMRFLLILSR